MAKIFGVSLTQYKKYEHGLETIKIDTAQKWSLRFGTPFFYLVKDSDYQLPSADLEGHFKLKLFRANSLTDEYFRKLVGIMLLFTNKQCLESELNITKIERKDMDVALLELNNTIYITIAKGLKEFRGRFDICQERMSEYLGVSVSTLQHYEKESMKPRFSITLACRFYLATSISPLALLKGTKYSQIRYMQEERMEVLRSIVKDISQDTLEHLRPLLNGFFDMVKTTPNTMLI